MDIKTTLRTQLDLVVREAWIDYQFSADFRRAWDQASYAWAPQMEAMKEDVIASYEKDTGKKPSDDFVAKTLAVVYGQRALEGTGESGTPVLA